MGECLTPEDNDEGQETKHGTPCPDCVRGITTLSAPQSCPHRVGVHDTLAYDRHSLHGRTEEEGPAPSVVSLSMLPILMVTSTLS